MNLNLNRKRQVIVLLFCILLIVVELFIYSGNNFIDCIKNIYSLYYWNISEADDESFDLLRTWVWAIALLVVTILFFLIGNAKVMAVSLREALKAEAGIVPRIGIVIYVVLHLPLCEHFLHDFITEGDAIGLPRAIIALSFIFIPFIFEAQLLRWFNKDETGEPKILIVALSLLPGLESNEAKYTRDGLEPILSGLLNHTDPDKKFIKLEEKGSNLSETRWSVWDPIRRSLERHANLEKVVIIGSPEAIEMLYVIKNECRKEEFYLPDLIKRFYFAKHNKEISFDKKEIPSYICLQLTDEQKKRTGFINVSNKYVTRFDDFNDFEACYRNLSDLINLLLSPNGMTQSTIAINCTGGNSIVTSSLVFQGIIRNISLWYVSQNSQKDYIKIKANKMAVSDLWDAIGEMLGAKGRNNVRE